MDAWLDLRDRTIKGPGITERTTYLIMGERPVLPPGVQPEANPLAAAIVDMLGKIDEMETKAQRTGRAPRAVPAVPVADRLQAAAGASQPDDLSSSSYLRGPGGIKALCDKDKEDNSRSNDGRSWFDRPVARHETRPGRRRNLSRRIDADGPSWLRSQSTFVPP